MRRLRHPEPWRINLCPPPQRGGFAALSRRFIVRATNPDIRRSFSRPPYRRSVMGAALALAALLATTQSCSRAPESPEGLSRSEEPLVLRRQRVVSLTPSITHIVQGLGRGDRLVGTSRHGSVEGVPVVADMEPRIEAILKVDPDLVPVSYTHLTLPTKA